jgi:inosine-uridine nucleoside N-ribohydrolase
MNLASSNRRLFFLLCIILTWAVGASGVPAFHGDDAGPPLVIDTDMGLDDIRALMALVPAKSGSIHALLFVEGSASSREGFANLHALLAFLDAPRTPVLRGETKPGLPPPPWRRQADRAGGLALPELPELGPGPDLLELLRALLAEHADALHYLALGPLGNLAALDREAPSALNKLHTLWIPVDAFEEGAVSGWNLTWDRAAAEQVLKRPVNTVLIDIASAGARDGNRFLSSLEESGQSAPGIRAMAREMRAQGHPVFLYDELAAAAFLAPDLVKIDAERLRFDRIMKDRVLLVPDRGGTIRVARFLNGNAVRQVLKTVWESSPGRRDARSSSRLPLGKAARFASASLINRIKAFHGHLGPYVVIGYRMGRIALRETDTKGHFDLNAQVYSQPKPPPSCLIDGIQLGSGCTMGKGNITASEIAGPAYAIFTSDDGKRCTLRLKPEIPALIERLVDERGVEAAGEYFIERAEAELFEIENG